MAGDTRGTSGAEKAASSSSSPDDGTAAHQQVLQRQNETVVLIATPASVVIEKEKEGLLTHRQERIRKEPHHPADDWLEPLALGFGLLLLLFAFWVLDSLKDVVLGRLTGGHLERHQPPAKLVSVATTLSLVCLLEYASNERRKQSQSRQRETVEGMEDMLDDIPWTRMSVSTDYERPVMDPLEGEGIPSSIFLSIGIPYCVIFLVMAYCVHVYNGQDTIEESDGDSVSVWTVAGYVLFAAIESFGSLSVAAFWSFLNSTVSLRQAERWYGGIVAMAQVGAIGGSTLVATHYWSAPVLIVVAVVVMVLYMLVMMWCSRHFSAVRRREALREAENNQRQRHESSQRDNAILKKEPPAVSCLPSSKSTSSTSGLYLILQHNYVLLILGVSCLYEVSLTCLNYQMTLLGWERFVTETLPGDTPSFEQDGTDDNATTMTFTQFMGHYGQMVNISSLFLSSLVFPWLIQRVHLKWTLRLFPTLLLLANLLAFRAFPGSLPLLFVSMSLLKAMCYSIHDPATELLYLPTSPAIKYQCKFWIDVVGARIAKAIGSSLNTMGAGSVPESIRVASAPSLLSAVALFWVCWRAGLQFDHLIQTNTVVGDEHVHDESQPEPNSAPERVMDEEEGEDGRSPTTKEGEASV